MMALDAPAPWVRPRFAKHREVIKLGIAHGGFVFQVIKDLFEAHDDGGFRKPLMTQSAAEQSFGQSALRRAHLTQRQALARFGNKMPIETLIILEFINGFGALLVRK